MYGSYSIRLEGKRSAATRLLFCTTGILLRTLESDADLTDFADGAGVSHVLVDEVSASELARTNDCVEIKCVRPPPPPLPPSFRS